MGWFDEYVKGVAADPYSYTDPNKNYNPFGAGGASLGEFDVLGNWMDKYVNPWSSNAQRKEAAKEAMKNAGGGGGMPVPPSMVGPDGKLLPQYALDPSKYNTGSDVLAALKLKAFDKGPSAWAQMQNKAIDFETAGLRDQAGRDASLGLGQGMSNLAASGGLDSGARERLSMAAGANRLNSTQLASRQGNQAKFATGIEDQRQKSSLMQALPGMYQSNAAFNANIDARNAQNAMQSELFKYGEQMKGYTGDKMAAATLGSGGKK